MVSNPRMEGHREKTLSHLDVWQIRKAVEELRASSPRSALADLVEEKIQALELGDPIPQHVEVHQDVRIV